MLISLSVCPSNVIVDAKLDEAPVASKKALRITPVKARANSTDIPHSPRISKMEALPYVHLTTHAGLSGVEPVPVNVRILVLHKEFEKNSLLLHGWMY